MNPRESLSSADLSRWPNQPPEQKAQVPLILEWKTVPSNNGSEPKQIPYRWLCGRDERGEPTNPEGLGKEKLIQYIPAVKDKATRHQNEWQGSLADHPAVEDRIKWEMPVWIDYRAEAIEAAQSANQVEIVATSIDDRI